MYKGASENAQAAVSRTRLRHLPAGAGDQSREEERRNLVARWKQIEAQIVACKYPDHKRKLAAIKMDLQAQIHAIRPKARCPAMPHHFIAACRAILTPVMFDAVQREAVRLSGQDPIGTL